MVPELFYNIFLSNYYYYYDRRDYELSDITTGAIVFIIFFSIIELVLFIPLLAAMVRRLHDIGRSGCWILIQVIPFGYICLLYMLILDSQSGSNEYGESPKYGQNLNDPMINNGGLGVVQPGMYPNQNPIIPPDYGQQPIFNGQENVNIQPNLYEPPEEGGIPVYVNGQENININVQPNLYEPPLEQAGQPINNPSIEPEDQQNINEINPSEEQQFINQNVNDNPASDNLFDKPSN